MFNLNLSHIYVLVSFSYVIPDKFLSKSQIDLLANYFYRIFIISYYYII